MRGDITPDPVFAAQLLQSLFRGTRSHPGRPEGTLGQVAKAAQHGLKMQSDLQPCQHQLSRPPDLVTSAEDVIYLVFDCILCGCQVSLRLNSEGEIDGEFI